MIDTQAIRKKILDLALRGKLTEQLPGDGTAEELYQRIQDEKEKLVRRIERFKDVTRTRKGILPTLVTTFGLKRNANGAMIANVVALDDLFK